MRHLVRMSAVACLVAGIALVGVDLGAQGRPSILVAEVRGVITPVIAEYLSQGTKRAAREGYDAFLVEIDTPGGLDSATREIVQAFLNADVPVIVYVAPSGARAASAGAFITMAGHVAAMSPGTNIGAATPVDMQGGEIGDKIIEDSTAYAVALAELRGRDEGFARDMVRDGRSVPASQAVEIGAVDLVAPNRAELLRTIDGTSVALDEATEVTLRTGGADFVDHELGFLKGVQQRLADPNLAFLFLSLGTLAVIYELANPGVGLGGILGAIMLVLAFFALAVLPVNVAGVLLLLLALGLFVAELFVPGVGVFAAGGAVSLALAGVFLFRGDIGVDLAVILPTAIVITGGVVLAGRLVWRARVSRSATGRGQPVGQETEIKSVEGTRGRVFVDGSWWTARTREPLEEGTRVRVLDMEGLELVVEPIEPAAAGGEGKEEGT